MCVHMHVPIPKTDELLFSCVLPTCLWQQKINGSWQIRLLKKTVTPEIIKRYLTNSVNDLAIIMYM